MNADLAGRLESGAFRRDLYARLSGYVVELPPLRERRGDVAALAEHFLGGAARLTAGFLEPLLLAPWPMNVRELKTVLARVELLAGAAGPLTGAHARAALGAATAAEAMGFEPPPLPEPEAEPPAPAPSREELEALLVEHGGNIKQLALHYGKHRKQIYRWLERHGLDADRFRRG